MQELTLIREMVEAESQVDTNLKTQLMYQLEDKFRTPIKILIAPQAGVSAKTIADRLGIAESTLSEWRERLGFTDVRRIKPGPKSKMSA